MAKFQFYSILERQAAGVGTRWCWKYDERIESPLAFNTFQECVDDARRWELHTAPLPNDVRIEDLIVFHNKALLREQPGQHYLLNTFELIKEQANRTLVEGPNARIKHHLTTILSLAEKLLAEVRSPYWREYRLP